jgi:glucose-1-phosphatase
LPFDWQAANVENSNFLPNHFSLQAMKIKNIIFDFGGVLLNVDYQKTQDAFVALGVTNFEEFYSQTNANPLFADLEKGLVPANEFYLAFQKATGLHIDRHLVQQAWCAMLINFRPKSFEFLDKLREKGYKIYLLSNTNAIHFDAFHRMFAEQHPHRSFESYFDVPYYSHLIHQRKPDAAAYQFVMDAHNMKPEESLFVDDTYKNIPPAEALGMQVCHLHTNGIIEERLSWLLD